ncbi:L-serine ammonia-lyase [Desulfovibrio sulfodismutans]|uniref:L-serine dehydratase n=1 Tax=Desulfolutivibrio sulfodismutans TaxID=63561 RepID=A0A7K3NJQ8_9BACT|nr:L-serine ammonia-lyase [Desulfolutivibrio sulfodismutans]NDY56441.1 L-serine ammonia-lyase [Desulfolutivibrio sulfodismutans]QLA13799.1 L-serine ammonia-lyase [Desulfolutivibrio sulfodismutans DSM 3696]
MPAIDLSVFDLFKIGPGPSSSHTIGPMKAGYEFIQAARALPAEALAKAAGIEVRLYGSLSATGKGHGTDRAVLAGLLGRSPESCSPDFLDDLARTPLAGRPVDLGGVRLMLNAGNVIFDAVEHDHPFNNTLVIRLTTADPQAAPLLEREYYSVGGGFIQIKGQEEPPRGTPLYPYGTMAELKERLAENDLSLPRLILENEMAVTGADETTVMAGVDTILRVMDAAVSAGLAAEGVLPGPIGLARKAKRILERSRIKSQVQETIIGHMCAYAFAVAEENAAGHIIVTAPTCGSAGIIPAMARIMRTRLSLPEQSIREGLLAAAAIGFLAKHNATIAGAEGGCQAEIGVASAMAAAMLAQASGYGPHVTEHAAETALEHHLGMTCDPVGGYVQIPCIERNAVSVVKAYTAFIIASDESPATHKVGLDQAIAAMMDTGRDMSCKYKETAQGGLAVCVATC